MTFSPFMNEADAMEINGLKIENRVDRISLYGTLAITRDKAGLAAAMQLKTTVDRIVETLQRKRELPDMIADAIPSQSVKNPFA